jgi:uncharacterized protein (TIGR02246 family)
MSGMTHTYEIATSPTEVVRIFSGLLQAGDVDGLMTMYDEEATFSPERGALATGPTEIRAVLTAMTDPPPQVESTVTWVQQVGDHALVLNDYSIRSVGPDGGPVQITGRSADVVHRGADGGWRFLIDCVWGGTAT